MMINYCTLRTSTSLSTNNKPNNVSPAKDGKTEASKYEIDREHCFIQYIHSQMFFVYYIRR